MKVRGQLGLEKIAKFVEENLDDNVAAIHLSTSNPTTGDSASKGYYVGYVWINTSTYDIFDLVDAGSMANWVKREAPTPVTMSGTPNYLTLVGQDIVRGLVSLVNHVTGILGIANGGTGASTQQEAINNITDVASATDEYVLTKDTASGDAIWKSSGGGSDGNGIFDVANNGATVPTAYDIGLTDIINFLANTSTKNIGVNTASPGGKVHITGTNTSSAVPVLRLDRPAGAIDGMILDWQVGGGYWGIGFDGLNTVQFTSPGSTDPIWSFGEGQQASHVPFLVINAQTNSFVAINGATGNAKLEVNGSSTSTEYVLKLHDNTGTSTNLTVRNDGRIAIGSDALATWLGIRANTTTEASMRLVASAGVNVTTPVSGDMWWNGTNLYFYDGTVSVDLLASAGGGETNTASNVNVGGVGVFKQKTGVDLEFKGINAGSSKITVADDVGNNEIDIDVSEANLTLDNIGGTLSISKGGTGQTAKTAAYDALSPTTTAGDVTYNNGTDNIRLGIGTKHQVFKTNAGATAPEWADGGYCLVFVPEQFFDVDSVGLSFLGTSGTHFAGFGGANPDEDHWSIQFNLPSDWVSGGRFKIYFVTEATTDDVGYEIAITISNNDEDMSTVTETLAPQYTAGSATSWYRRELGTYDITATLAAGDTVTANIARDASDAGDTYAGVAYIAMIEFEYNY